MEGLKNGYLVAQQDQVASHGEAGRTAADNGDLLFLTLDWLEWRALVLIALGVDIVGREALEVAHGHGLVEILAIALGFAGVLANSTAHRGQRATLFDQFVGLVEFAGRTILLAFFSAADENQFAEIVRLKNLFSGTLPRLAFLPVAVYENDKELLR